MNLAEAIAKTWGWDTDIEPWASLVDSRKKFLRDKLPSGGGFNSGTEVDADPKECHKEYYLDTAFWEYQEPGFLVEVHEFPVTVCAVFGGFEISLPPSCGPDIREYVADTFYHLLKEDVVWPAELSGDEERKTSGNRQA